MTTSPSALDALLSTLRTKEGVATAHIDDGWMQGRTAYGGISSAVALAGTMALHPTDAPLRPRNNYLDQANPLRKREVPTGGLTPEAARALLEAQVTRQEQQNAQAYRQLAAPTRPSRVKKGW